jgi:hypothetical protein
LEGCSPSISAQPSGQGSTSNRVTYIFGYYDRIYT